MTTHAPRWSLLLWVVGLAVVLLGTAAGSQGWQAWWLAGSEAVSHQIVWDIRLPRSLGRASIAGWSFPPSPPTWP